MADPREKKEINFTREVMFRYFIWGVSWKAFVQEYQNYPTHKANFWTNIFIQIESFCKVSHGLVTNYGCYKKHLKPSLIASCVLKFFI